MKPLKLIMSAFGPFRDVVKVSFEDFGQNGLFLVTGDTGAGKTTIFDAISFALFGNASGENRTADCFRSDFAGNEDKTYVELTFSHKNKTYRVQRNPLYVRSKLKGDGTTQEKANATLTLPDGRIVNGYVPVTEAIASLLGIDWRQYKQIAMIAQGEFLQLLTASSQERGIIFRKVFGTQIYDEIQKKLKNMAMSLKYKCEDIDKSILQYLSGIVFDEESVHYQGITDWKASKDINQLQKVMELLRIIIDADKQKLEAEKSKNDLLSSQIKEKSIEYTNAVRTNQMLANMTKAREEYQVLLDSAEDMQLKESLLLSARKALYTVKPSEDIYLRIKKELDKLKEDIMHQSEEVNRQVETLANNLRIWKQKEADKPRINELITKISREEEDLPKYEAVIKLEAEKVSLEESKLILERKATEISEHKDILTAEQAEKQKKLDSYSNLERDILECQNQIEAQNRLIGSLDKLSDDLAGLIKENALLNRLQSDLLKAEESFRTKNTIYIEAEALFYREQAGILAASLNEGEPCPVCGSVHHPDKAALTADALSEEQLKSYKAEEEKARKLMQESGNLCNNQKTKTEMLKKQLVSGVSETLNTNEPIPFDNLGGILKDHITKEDVTFHELKAKEAALSAKSNKKAFCVNRLSKIAEELRELEELFSQTKEKLSDNSNLFNKNAGTMTAIRNDLKYATKKEAVEALEADRKELLILQEALITAENIYRESEAKLSNLKAVLEDNRSKSAGKEKELEQEYSVFTDKLKQSGFVDLDKYKEVLLSEEELESQMKILDTYRKNCEQLKEMIKQLQKETLDTQERDLKVILAQQAQLEQQKLLGEEQMQRIYSRLETDKDIYDNAYAKYKEQENTRREYLLVSDLSKTANGELSGKAKIAFEHYVQAFYFNSVINEANKRLYKMSNSQFILLRKEDPTNLRSASGLELEVMDYYTGKPRSINSLSGGESFKAALSLALGLSDVIQSFAGGIDVDAMFIDEGFGSLDSNSLEQAIETLNALTTGNRIVGIISHVSELKERIDKKISIEKSMNGSKLSLIK